MADARQTLERAGDTGRDLLQVDWAATAVGPLEQWPSSLTSTIQMTLASRFAMWMCWGEELTFFCNEAYRRDTLASKYPWALGKPANVVWEEIWPDIEDRVEQVMGRGESTWDEGLMLFLERSGYKEETYHTFSYSPLAGDDGSIVGLLCVVSEETGRFVGERRMRTLRDLSAELTAAVTERELVDAGCAQLATNRQDLPFTLIYLFDADGATARLACSTGIDAGHPAAPAVVDVAAGGPWPLQDLADAVLLDDLPARVGDLPAGAWDEPPAHVLLTPLAGAGTDDAYGVLVAGLNPHRPPDEENIAFVGLIAGQLAAGIASARSYEAERRRAEQLAEVDRAKTAFFTNVSHELRTPLTLLIGPAEDALTDPAEPLGPAQRRRVEVIARNGDRLLKLVNTLLDFSRLEAGRSSARYEPLDLARLTSEMASMFESAVQRAGLELRIDCPPLGQDVHVDREMWAKIVLNLVSNALKFTFDGGIAVRLQTAGERVLLTVTDTGIGVDAAEQEHLFERFRRVEGARSRTHEGSGIGLALVAELAALHGGGVAVSSTPGEGSRFTVEIPLGTAHLPEHQVGAAPGAQPAPVVAQAQGFVAEALRWMTTADAAAVDRGAEDTRPRVLIADDNADMRRYMQELLETDYRVQTAEDGAIALALAREQPPDLVLTDVMMPNLDGFGLLAALQADPATSEVPVVMVSARAGEEGTVEGLEAGADDYLVKPFAARELLARVRANLELDRVRRARDELRRNQWLVDQAQELARVGSWEVDLATGDMTASDEFMRQMHLSREALRSDGLEKAISERLHPDDLARVDAAFAGMAEAGGIDYEARIVAPDGTVRTYRSIGIVDRDEAGNPARLRGSHQDVTDQREAQRQTSAAAAERKATERERQIGEELQRSLLPDVTVDAEHLDVATFYRAGAEGTQVGGDWYDVIEIGGGRTALVLGDVMGRGVKAAAVMGQLRAAVRAYARLDLAPADLLESLDGVVRDLDAESIATCVYAVHDANQQTLAFANAGHLPPLLVLPGEPPVRLMQAAGPPLGAGPLTLEEGSIALPPGSVLTVYTDGLVERRDRPLDDGIDALAERLAGAPPEIADIPRALVAALVPDGADDDIAVLVARVPASARPPKETLALESHADAVPQARAFAERSLADLPAPLDGDAMLVVSEMVTNAILHGAPPIQLSLLRTEDRVLIEVEDHATAIPRKRRPGPDDEHGRGLQLVAMIANQWGIRPTPAGKAVWCLLEPS